MHRLAYFAVEDGRGDRGVASRVRVEPVRFRRARHLHEPIEEFPFHGVPRILRDSHARALAAHERLNLGVAFRRLLDATIRVVVQVDERFDVASFAELAHVRIRSGLARRRVHRKRRRLLQRPAETQT